MGTWADCLLETGPSFLSGNAMTAKSANWGPSGRQSFQANNEQILM